jgi:hypothetical protein
MAVSANEGTLLKYLSRQIESEHPAQVADSPIAPMPSAFDDANHSDDADSGSVKSYAVELRVSSFRTYE